MKFKKGYFSKKTSDNEFICKCINFNISNIQFNKIAILVSNAISS